MLEEGASATTFSAHFWTTAFAEAFRLRNDELIKLLNPWASLNDMAEGPQVCAMLAAAAEVGDVVVLSALVERKTYCDSVSLGHALLKAVKANQSDAALLLLGAGASTRSKDIARVFDFYVHETGLGGLEFESALSPLIAALENRNSEWVEVLLDHEAELTMALDTAMAWGD